MIHISIFSAARRYSHVVLPGLVSSRSAPEAELIEAVKVALGKNFNTDWSGLDALPEIKWAPLSRTTLQKGLPNDG